MFVLTLEFGYPGVDNEGNPLLEDPKGLTVQVRAPGARIWYNAAWIDYPEVQAEVEVPVPGVWEFRSIVKGGGKHHCDSPPSESVEIDTRPMFAGSEWMYN